MALLFTLELFHTQMKANINKIKQCYIAHMIVIHFSQSPFLKHQLSSYYLATISLLKGKVAVVRVTVGITKRVCSVFLLPSLKPEVREQKSNDWI